MKDNEIIICSNCYEENKRGEKYCYNCGRPLYYNDTGKQLEVISENDEEDIIFYNENDFDNSIKFDNYIVAVSKNKKQIHFYYKQELENIINFENIIECKIVENSSTLESGRSQQSNSWWYSCRTVLVQ